MITRARGRLTLPGVLAVACLGAGAPAPAGPQAGAPPGAARYFAGDDGRLYLWLPGGDRLEDRTEALLGTLAKRAVKDLAPLGEGRLLVLLGPGDPDARGRAAPAKRAAREGLAIVFDSGRPGGEEPRAIRFEGDGQAVGVTADGTLAFILAQRIVPGGGQVGVLSWVHEVDPESGTVLGSVGVAGPAHGLAVDPRGGRIFVSRRDRILSCTTSPLVNSWYYRSPGQNAGLFLQPASAVLYAVRDQEVALFDPEAIAARPDHERLNRSDDASAVVPLPSAASRLAFSEDGRLAVAVGGGSPVFLDLEVKAVLPASGQPAALPGSGLLGPLRFPGVGGDLLFGLLPSLTVASVPGPLPPVAAARPAPASVTTPVPPPASQVPAAPGPPSPAPQAPIPEAPVPQPSVPETRVPAESGPPTASETAVLTGRVSGARGEVTEVVLYGPDSIVREEGRARPGPDGVWKMPLPPPGRYRVLPVGEASRPLRSRPNFQTVEVRPGQGWSGLDFEILGRS